MTFVIKKYGEGSDVLEQYDTGTDYVSALDKLQAEILDIGDDYCELSINTNGLIYQCHTQWEEGDDRLPIGDDIMCITLTWEDGVRI